MMDAILVFLGFMVFCALETNAYVLLIPFDRKEP